MEPQRTEPRIPRPVSPAGPYHGRSMAPAMRRPDALPDPDHRWVPREHAREDLRRALVQGGVAGIEVSHPLDNVLWKIARLVDGDPDLGFGLSGLPGPYDEWDILEMVAGLAGF